MKIADKLVAIAENEQKVYEAGQEKGVEVGKKAEYDAFWDAYQQNGTRRDYQGAFYGVGWDDTSFKPKYDLKPDNCGSMFLSAKITDLSALLQECGVKLDTSQCVRMDSMFYYAPNLTKVPTLDCRLVTQSGYFNATFRATPKLETIEKIILRDDGSQTFSNAFAMSAGKTNALKNITFEGVIGQNIDFQYSPLLSKASIENIVEHLSDSATGKTLTLSKAAVNNAFGDGLVEVYEYVDLNPRLDGADYTFSVSKENGTCKVTVNGGRGPEDMGGSWGSMLFVDGTLPEGEYELSFDCENDECGFWLTCVAEDYGDGVAPGTTRTFTVNEGDYVYIALDMMGKYNNATYSVTLKKKSLVNAWDALTATKPNWTISLV